MAKKKYIYECHFRNDNTNKYETSQFEASCDHDAKLIALDFCNQNEYKYYSILKIGDKNEKTKKK